MDSKIVPKVFVLAYELSEEDHGFICVFNSFELAKEAKEYAEKEAKTSLFFIRFRIDVYEVCSSLPKNLLEFYCHPGFQIKL